MASSTVTIKVSPYELQLITSALVVFQEWALSLDKKGHEFGDSGIGDPLRVVEGNAYQARSDAGRLIHQLGLKGQ